MTLIVLPPATTAFNPCRLGYENLLENGTVAVSSESPNFPGANAYDWLTADFWRPTGPGTASLTLTLPAGQAADYFAFYNQDLFLSGGNIRLQYWDGSAWADATDAITPSDNAPRMVFFGQVTSAMWRVVVSGPAVFNLGMVSFGRYLALPYGMYMGWTPPALARATGLTNSVSDSGAFLGRSIISRGVRTNLVLQFAADDWVRANWPAFVRHAEQKPFFFAPDVVKHPTDSVLCWVDGDIPPPAHTHYGYMGATLPVRGLVE